MGTTELYKIDVEEKLREISKPLVMRTPRNNFELNKIQ
jgi:hypothetical protein